MKYPMRLGVAACLICSSLMFAQSASSSTQHERKAPVSVSAVQETIQPRATTPHLGGVDILTDTMGVDFGSYLQGALRTVKQNWYKLAPPSARAPRMMQGQVSIEFAILRSGKIAGMKRVESSGDVPLDKAAWLGISDSRLPPLPAAFSGEYLGLRFHFVYNPAKFSDAILQFRE
jgi:TonB family protein